jgi:hypothetical protein
LADSSRRRQRAFTSAAGLCAVPLYNVRTKKGPFHGISSLLEHSASVPHSGPSRAAATGIPSGFFDINHMIGGSSNADLLIAPNHRNNDWTIFGPYSGNLQVKVGGVLVGTFAFNSVGNLVGGGFAFTKVGPPPTVFGSAADWVTAGLGQDWFIKFAGDNGIGTFKLTT